MPENSEPIIHPRWAGGVPVFVDMVKVPKLHNALSQPRRTIALLLERTKQRGARRWFSGVTMVRQQVRRADDHRKLVDDTHRALRACHGGRRSFDHQARRCE